MSNTEQPYQLAQRIAPGIWIDKGGNLHISVPELLKRFGWPDDAEHRAGVTAAVRQVLRENGIEWSENL